MTLAGSQLLRQPLREILAAFDAIRPRYEELKRLNCEGLQSGEVKTEEIILSAAARLMAG